MNQEPKSAYFADFPAVKVSGENATLDRKSG
jgi:hypothetical protein